MNRFLNGVFWVALFFFLVSGAKADYGPGYENFEGSYANRTFRVLNYSSGDPVTQYLVFPNFDALLNSTGAQKLQSNVAYLPSLTNTPQIAKIVRDPVNSSNRALWLRAIPKPGDGSGRNEIHYDAPYKTYSQPNGTKYTLAFRFYTSTVLERKVNLMQGFASGDGPWLRITAYDQNLKLDTVRCTKGIVCNGVSDPNTIIKNVSLGYYRVGKWNTVVVHVLHTNRETGGYINVYLNGVKTTWTGRTTFESSSTNVPWMKAGPYPGKYIDADVYYDDIYWQPGFVLPYGG